jgi:hypothetical protein
MVSFLINDLSFNFLETIDSINFTNFKKLKQLYLNNNLIKSIDNIKFPSTILKLNLNDNKIDLITFDILSNLIQVTDLYISSNQISSIEKDLFLFPNNIKNLDISNNSIESYDINSLNGLYSLSKLKISLANLSWNDLCNLKQSFENNMLNNSYLGTYLGKDQYRTLYIIASDYYDCELTIYFSSFNILLNMFDDEDYVKFIRNCRSIELRGKNMKNWKYRCEN